MTTRKFPGWLAAAIAALALLSGCSGDEGGNDPATVRTFNAVVDTEPVDLLIGETVVAPALAPGIVTPYGQVDSGQRVVRVRSTLAGATNLSQATLNFFPDTRQTIVLRGQRSAIAILQLNDDTADPAAGKFKLRVMNLSFDTASYDVYVGNGDIATATPAVSALAYGTLADFIELDAGSRVIVYTLTGTKDVVFRSEPLTFAEREKVSIAIQPSRSGRLVNAALLRANEGGVVNNTQSRLKLVNGIPGAVLDIKSNGSLVQTGVVYSGASSYAETPAGARTLQLEATNVPGTAMATLAATLDPGRDHSALAWGTLSAPRLLLLTDDNTVAVLNNAKLRFVNALADNAPVDVLVNFVGRHSSFAAGTASAYGTVPSGRSHTITFTAPGGTSVIATVDTGTVAAGGVYTVYLVGSSAAPIARLVTDR